MKPIPSPLNIIDVTVLNFEYAFVFPKEEIDFKQNFENYELDIDFSIRSNGFLEVFMRSEINRGTVKLPGYSIYAEIVCVFEINKDIKLSDEAKSNIEGFSTIYIALNNLRGIISQFTGNAPLGRYILPSVDLNNLIEQKKALIGKDTKTAKPSKTKKKQ